MERYFPVVSNSSFNKSRDKKCESIRYQPYGPSRSSTAASSSIRDEKNIKYSATAMTTFLLETLSDETNPITHSDIGSRSDIVFSTSTGHQVSNGRGGQRLYLEERECKLAIQREKPGNQAQVLKNVRVYINGYLENTTDIEVKAIVLGAGGQILPTPSTCTHVLTSQQLCGSKTQKFLNTKARNKYHVVKPEWVFDSIKMGKRRPEREYAVILSSEAKTMSSMLKSQSSRTS